MIKNYKKPANGKVKFKQEYVDNDIILSVNHLKQFFDLGGGYKTKAVHNVSFQIKEGECFGLVGESGCGKTTTGRCIMGLYHPTSGSIYYKGTRILGGTRWNEKEIKWSRIHTKEKIKALKLEMTGKISRLESGESAGETKIAELENEYNDKIRDATLTMKEELQEKNDPTNEENDANLKNIEDTWNTRIANLKKDLEAKLEECKNASSASPDDATKESIIKDYQAKIDALKQWQKEHEAEQRSKIRQIRYDNKHQDRKLMNEIQMIFQDPIDSLDPRMTVEDIIQEGLHIQHQYNKVENHKKCVDILEKVGLIADYASRYPHEFSGGQRQRIGIARALIMNPKLLICDEPISALDVSIRAQILNLLNELKEEMGLTLMFIAHDLSVVKYFCDRIAVMYFGNMVELATSEELFAHPLHPYTRALLSAIPKPDPLSEKNRIRKIYKPAEAHDYSRQKPSFQEILPGHFVLANDAEIEKYKQEIAELDAKAASESKEEAPAEKAE